MNTTRKVKAVANENYLAERSETFVLPDGTTLSKGDQVDVADDDGVWKFAYAWRNQPVFFGGQPGHGQFCSFRVERLGKHKPKKSRNLSDEQRQALRDRMAQVRAARKAVTA